MSEVNSIDEIRRGALNRIEQTERNYRVAFVGAAMVETLFIAGFVLLADFSNRTHVLLLLVTVSTFTIIALGLLALAAHIDRTALRVLNAVELLASRLSVDR